MLRISLYRSAELRAGLRQAAKRLGTTQTQIVQRALAKYLEEVERPRLESLGAGAEASGASEEQWLREHWGARRRAPAANRRT
jgi:predicted DNA-binding protein